MALTFSCAKLHFYIQNNISLPLTLIKLKSKEEKNSFALIPNPLFKKWHFSIVKNSAKVFLIFSIFRAVSLFNKWHESTNILTELGFNLFTAAACCIALAEYITKERHLNDFCFLITQRFKQFPLSNSRNGKLCQRDILKAFFVYCMAFIIFTFAIALGVYPVKRGYDVIQYILFHVLCISSNHILILCIQVQVGVLYIVLIVHGANFILSGILIIMIFIEAIQQESYHLHGNTYLAFENSVKLFRILQIMISTANQINREFSAFFVGMGILTAVCASFAGLLLYDDLPFGVYVSATLLSTLTIAINFLFVSLVSIPNRNASEYQIFWKLRIEKKNLLNWKILRGCPPIGYSIGPAIVRVKSITALTIIDIILSSTATFAVLTMSNLSHKE